MFGGGEINEVTQKALNVLEEKLIEIEQVQKNEINQIRGQVQPMQVWITKQEENFEEYKATSTEKLEEIRVTYEQKFIEYSQSDRDRLEQIQVDVKQRLDQIQIKYDKKLGQQREDYEKSLERIQIKYDQKILQQQEVYKDELERIQRVFRDIKVEYEQHRQWYKKRLDEVQIKYDRIILEQRKEHKNNLDEVKSKLKQVQNRLQLLLDENAIYKGEVQLLQEKVKQQENQLEQYKKLNNLEQIERQIKCDIGAYVKEEIKFMVEQNNSQILTKVQEIHVLQGELATQKIAIEKIKLELNEQKEQIKVQHQEGNVLQDQIVNEEKGAVVEEIQPIDKNDLLDSILNYEWDDEDDFDFIDSYKVSKSDQEIDQKAAELSINTVDNNKNNIYDQFKEYMSQNEVYNNPGKEFILHARWMEEYEENQILSEAVPFENIEPTYKEMTIEQMKWYFYWRANARKGKFIVTDIGYIILYSYEILNNIGIKDYGEGHKKLISILREYGESYKIIEGQLPQWIHDYLIIYGDAKNLFEVIKELKEVSHGSHFIERAHFIKCLLTREYSQLTELLNRFSDYKVIKQKLCKDTDNRKLYDRVLEDVVVEIDQSLKKTEGIDFAKKIIGPTKVDYWKVFNHAPKDLSDIQERYPIYTAIGEIKYWYDGDHWNATYAGMRNDFDRIYITNLLKYIESIICKRLNIKRELKLGTIPLYMENIVKEVTSRYCNESVAKIEAIEIRAITPQNVVQQPTVYVESILKEDNIYNLIAKYLYNEKIRQNGYKFYKQAKSMEDQESFNIIVNGGDVAQREAKLIEGYFKWRKAVKKGIYDEAEEIYVYTYIYEIINDIGIKDTEDGMMKLICILESYGSQYEGLQEQLSKWIVDYVIYYNCISEEKFYTILNNINPGSTIFHDWSTIALLMGEKVREPLYYLNRISSYDIYKSHYYYRGIDEVMNKVIKLVVCRMENLLLINKKPHLYEIVVRGKVKEREWTPFENAPFYNKVKHLLLNSKTNYTISKYIRYSMKRGFWQTNIPEIAEIKGNEYIGKLLECIAYHVYKRSNSYIGEMNNINVPEYLEHAIENAVKECLNNNRK